MTDTDSGHGSDVLILVKQIQCTIALMGPTADYRHCAAGAATAAAAVEGDGFDACHPSRSDSAVATPRLRGPSLPVVAC